MAVNDTIADMLTRIRNGAMAKHSKITIPKSKIIEEIAKILHEEGYIEQYQVIPSQPQSILQLDLKYTKERHPKSVITGLKKVSKPGRRVYTKYNDIPWVRSGLGIAILTTPKGVMTGKKARYLGVGGEVLCYVW